MQGRLVRRENEFTEDELIIIGAKMKALISKKKKRLNIIGMEVFGKNKENAPQHMNRLLGGITKSASRNDFQRILDYIGATWEELEDTDPYPGNTVIEKAFIGAAEPPAILKIIWPEWKRFSDAYQSALKTGNKKLINAAIDAAKEDLSNNL